MAILLHHAWRSALLAQTEDTAHKLAQQQQAITAMSVTLQLSGGKRLMPDVIKLLLLQLLLRWPLPGRLILLARH